MDEEKKYRSARIDVVSNGFIIEIGCQRVVAETPEKLKKLVCDYLDDPQGAEKRLLGKSVQLGAALNPVEPVSESQPTLGRAQNSATGTR